MKALTALALFSLAALPLLGEDESGQAVLKLGDPQAEFDSKKWQSTGPVAVGDFYSVAFQTKSADGFLAEYYQRVFFFGGTARDGEFVAAFRLQMNTGGRTHVLLYRHVDEKGQLQFVTFHDRFGEQTIDIARRDFHPAKEPLPANLKKEFVGTFSGEAFPLKFFTPLVLAEAEAVKRLK